MARRAHAYPQVDPRAASLVDVRVVSAPGRLTVEDAGRLLARRRAGVLAVGARAWVLGDDMARARDLGLGAIEVAALARPLPAVAPDASEIAVRRLLASGAPTAIVTGRGAVSRAAAPVASGPSIRPRMAAALPPAARALADAAIALAGPRRARVFLVGGVVRDALRGAVAPGPDADLVVEGDGLAFARALADRLGGTVVEHPRFLTASVTTARGRIDVATARRERYVTPGALPSVSPAGITEDLGRRDFTVNAMAVGLGPDGWELLDPHGGRADLRHRILRVLHPLSAVEDPTRIFRAARYAARLGLRLAGETVAAARLAVRLGAFPALSGGRLSAELRLVLAEREAAAALRTLGRLRAFTLLAPGHRLTGATRAHLAGLPAALRWAEQEGLSADPLELALVALLAEQTPAVAGTCLDRLGLTGSPRRRVEQARRLHPASLVGLDPSGAGGALRGRSDLEVAWMGLATGTTGRAALTRLRERLRQARPVLDGDEVIALGVPRGPAVAEVLAVLRQGRLEGRLRDRKTEVRCVRDWLRRRPSAGREG